MEVQNDLESILGVTLPEGFLWQQPTLRAACEALITIWEEAKHGTGPTDVIVAEPVEGDLPVSSGQQRLWFLHQMSPDVPAYNIHFGLRMQGLLRWKC